MWRKYLIYFLLINILNTALFSAENVDDTPYDGIEEINQEEINSLTEYFFEDFLGYIDNTPEDEDDDNPEILKMEKQSEAFIMYSIDLKISSYCQKINYSTFYLSKANTFTSDVISPPPKG